MTKNGLLFPAYWTWVPRVSDVQRKQWEVTRTKVGSVSIEDGEPYELLRDLGPASNEESNQVASTEDSPLAKLAV